MARISRYRALRMLGADVLSAAVIAFLNWQFGAPENEIHFMGKIIEIEDQDAIE